MVSRINVLTKNYKYVVSYIWFTTVMFNKFISLKLPYWISKSRVSPELREEMERVIKELGRE